VVKRRQKRRQSLRRVPASASPSPQPHGPTLSGQYTAYQGERFLLLAWTQQAAKRPLRVLGTVTAQNRQRRQPRNKVASLSYGPSATEFGTSVLLPLTVRIYHGKLKHEGFGKSQIQNILHYVSRIRNRVTKLAVSDCGYQVATVGVEGRASDLDTRLLPTSSSTTWPQQMVVPTGK
jgi:hypothetical protein